MSMIVFESRHTLEWGSLDLPLVGIRRDWFGVPVEPPPAWSLAMDARRLWFVATDRRPARLHPRSRPGKFLAGLWAYDVAELFLTHPAGDRYLELNLSPNGAWWSALFRGPRERLNSEDVPFPGVETHAGTQPDGTWVAALSLPREELREALDFGPETAGNVCFILGSPESRFLSAADLGGGEPDFHRPDKFHRLRFVDDGISCPDGG